MKVSLLLIILSTSTGHPLLQNADVNVEDNICHSSDELLPHETDCSLYYQCVGLTPVLRECPSGLYFDPILNICNWPQNVDCENETTTDVATETTTTEATNVTEYKGKVTKTI